MSIKSLLVSVFLVGFLSSCSINNVKQTTVSKKELFEQKFAEQCVEKEVRNSINKDNDRLRFAKPCSCIAKRIASRLAEREMDKFLVEHKITHSLTMSFDKAAYFCVQNVTRPKTRYLVGKKPAASK